MLAISTRQILFKAPGVRSFWSSSIRKDDEKNGFIKSVLYGKELEGAGNVLAPEISQSKKLARGKYVHEMQSKFQRLSDYMIKD